MVERTEFLETYKKYQLGDLVTERPHPDTVGLSKLVNTNLSEAIDLMKSVDLKALNQFINYSDQIEGVREACEKTLAEGGRIFLCGCGATGRLSLTIEFLWREKYKTDQVISLMAGGDIALVHSLEGFEDYPEFGERHLKQLGFTENDLLIGTTEGGETPYVIGAVEAALEISSRKPYMLYCNPDDLLIDKVERSKRVIENPSIETVCLYVGPMSLSGSTRMQASTVLQLALGFALVERDKPVKDQISLFTSQLQDLELVKIKDLIEKEAQIYQEKEYVMYMPRKMAITVFTDTTERSPTFNLPSFEGNDYRGKHPSLCYILIPSAETSSCAWNELLQHTPRPLNWEEVDSQTTTDYLNQFDFSKNSLEHREERLGDVRQYLFEIDCKGDTLMLSLGGVEVDFSLSVKEELMRHTLLKIILNTHSTLMMGLLGRYKSNIMTWVTATNGKLIDRASRYVQILLQEKGVEIEYLDVVQRVFDLKENLDDNECVVLKVIEDFEKQTA